MLMANLEKKVGYVFAHFSSIERTAGLIAVLLLFFGLVPAERAACQSSEQSDRVEATGDFRMADIDEIIIARRDGNELILRRSAAGAFAPVAQKDLEFNLRKIDSVLNAVRSLKSARAVDGVAWNRHDYGFDDPSAMVSVLPVEGQAVEYLVGDVQAERRYRYTTVRGRETVQRASIRDLAPLFWDIGELRVTDLPSINIADLQRIEVQRASGRTLAVRQLSREEKAENPELALFNYGVVAPFKRVYGFSLNYVLPFADAVGDLNIVRFVDDPGDALGTYGLRRPYDRVLVEDSRNTIEVDLGGNAPDGRYARVRGFPGVAVVDGAQAVFAIPFRQSVASFSLIVPVEAVERVVIAAAETVHVVRIVRPSGGVDRATPDSGAATPDPAPEYYFNEKRISSTTFQELYQSLIGLRFDIEAGEQLQSIGNAISIRYRLTDGTRRSVEFYPHNNDYYAVFRDGLAEFLIRSSKLDSLLEKLRHAENGN